MDRIPLNVLFGVPDYAPGRVRATPDGRRLGLPVEGHVSQEAARVTGRFIRAGERQRIGLPGITNFVPFLSPERFALSSFYLQSGVELHIDPGPGAILNQIADPDACPESLKLAAQLVNKTSKPCFNRPDAVERTSRDGIARMLMGIDGLDVPKTIRVETPTPSSVREAIERGGLEYPVLLRDVGTHRGDSLSKAGRPTDLENIRSSHGLYVTEFRDFKSKDGLYRKFRVAIVRESIVLRHCIIGEHWRLHSENRTASSTQGEREILETFDSKWAPQLRPIFREMSARIDLDYYGVDFNVDDEGQMVLFEANAAMSMLRNIYPSPNMWDVPIARINHAVEHRLTSLSQQLSA